MRTKFSFFVVGKLLKILGLFMLIPAVCSLLYSEDDLWVFLVSGAVTSATGFLLEKLMATEESVDELRRKDGFMIATFSWVAAGIFGALPFLLYGVFPHPVDALFESISGFTTTGATVLEEIETLPHGIIFWRSFTQWLGGMGIIVLAIAILPRLRVGGMQLMSLEGASPTAERIAPRISEIAKNLWYTYLVISAVMVTFLLITGMPLYDSFIHMFTIISTGGFSSKNLSVGAYNSASIEMVITFFMFVAGINFSLLFGLYHRKFSKLFSDSEFRFYTMFNIIIIVVVAFELLLRVGMEAGEAFRASAFQVISLSTGTGFATVNYNTWPVFTKWLFFILLFVGGCAGATTGGIKQIRLYILLKQCYHEIYKLIYPNEVLPIKVGKNVVEENAITGVAAFFVIYVLIFLLGALLIMLEGVPTITAISASAASLGNVGPGFEVVGPVGNFSSFSSVTKINLSLLMLLGRLEIFTVVVLFMPAFWKD